MPSPSPGSRAGSRRPPSLQGLWLCLCVRLEGAVGDPVGLCLKGSLFYVLRRDCRGHAGTQEGAVCNNPEAVMTGTRVMQSWWEQWPPVGALPSNRAQKEGSPGDSDVWPVLWGCHFLVGETGEAWGTGTLCADTLGSSCF